MKMARASKADLDAAIDVSNVIEQLEKGWMPYDDDSDKLERFDRDDAKQCQRALAAILDAASTGSLFRVTFGMTVVLDPRNELLDPAADTLELHPKLVAARDRVPPAPAAEATDVQWWLAELDQYGNPKLSDGAHSERAGADKAMYLIKSLGLDNKGKRWAVARVELSEPRPSSDGVNHDAVSACRSMVDAARAGGA
ncbi:hypothetical protein I35_1479 [Burkholderia cenocepacia H111]|uniref:hypothetical protein n=1 Tax=Burkholderia cenocepacia TaxID=95486 RepID=UPI0002343677|nr:hypothetical protein [Burkholderia cenocepacia]CDN60002.1 hypothetical protein I35_1479 [Burkholderia cenocepacia H111]